MEQDKSHFKVSVYDLSKKPDSIEFHQWRSKNTLERKSSPYNCYDSLKINDWTWAHCLYEDESYKILGECRGEFGGSVIFFHKEQPDRANYLTCTCPRMVEKRGDGFYITETLSHGIGAGSVIKINNPRDLISVHIDSLSLEWKYQRFNDLDRHEVYKILSGQGETLIDTIDFTFSLFFQHENRNYLIYSDYNATYLGEVRSSSIVFLDTLVETHAIDYSDIPGELVGNIYHNHFERKFGTGAMHMYSKGDIYVKQDTIVIGYIYKEWPRPKGEF